MPEITAEFENVERAEAAATAIYRYFPDVERVIISRRIYKRSIDTPFMLPYPPKHGRDDFIMQPEWYGYDTDTEYLEAAISRKCTMTVHLSQTDRAVAGRLYNLGGSNVSQRQ